MGAGLGRGRASSTLCAVSLVPTPATTVAAVADGLEDGPQELVLLGVGGGRRLPRRAVDDQPVVAVVDQVRGEALGAVEVEPAVGGERRDHRGEHPAEEGRARHAAHGIAPPAPGGPRHRAAAGGTGPRC